MQNWHLARGHDIDFPSNYLADTVTLLALYINNYSNEQAFAWITVRNRNVVCVTFSPHDLVCCIRSFCKFEDSVCGCYDVSAGKELLTFRKLKQSKKHRTKSLETSYPEDERTAFLQNFGNYVCCYNVTSLKIWIVRETGVKIPNHDSC